jgi:L-arabinose isomerase
MNLEQYEVWFVVGSQQLYGSEALRQVREHATRIADGLNAAREIPTRVVFRSVLTSSSGIRSLAQEANASEQCVGVIAWMHTFSPAKMWLSGLSALQKPLCHLHTQYNRDIPWSSIDMEFMNLNQSAHGGREFGYAASRLGVERKVVVGHWESEQVQRRLGTWARAACGVAALSAAKIARFGDNMRYVAVTDGDKVGFQADLGVAVNGYGLGDLTPFVDGVTDKAIDELVAEYDESYAVAAELRTDGERRSDLREAARVELGIRAFLDQGGYNGFTDTFENLSGLHHLPGLSAQRLMADGYGFGAEGDWKTAALLYAAKVMDRGLAGGTSFMEDYTYHLEPGNEQVLGAHMLEICPTISAAAKPSVEIHPLSIGGKADPVRLVFDAGRGPAVNFSVIDMGGRFRIILNEVDVIEPQEPLPNLPVARALWRPRPNLETAAAGWIHAGGAHHTVFSRALETEHIRDFCEMLGIELVTIDGESDIPSIKERLRWNDLYYRLRGITG